MSATTPPAPILSAFTALPGGDSLAIAPGAPLVVLGGSSATWWDAGAPIVVALPPNFGGDGARWTADGKALRVHLGHIDIAKRSWVPAPALAHWNEAGPSGDLPVKSVAWFEDASHVALLRTGDLAKQATEIVITSLADGRARGRRVIEGASALVAASDRVLVIGDTGQKVVLLDLDANVIAEPAGIPLPVARVRQGAGSFAVIGAAGGVALMRPADGAVLATWNVQVDDAVPMRGGVLAVDFEGKVHAGCLEGNTVRTVAVAPSGVANPIIQIAGDQVAVAGAGPSPVRVATFHDPCR